MSSILKALKKLEEEKSLFQEEQKINVSREILRQPAENRRIVKWLWLLGSASAIVIMVLAVALMRKSAPREEVKSRELPIARQPAAPFPPLQNLPVSTESAGNVKGTKPASPLSSNGQSLTTSQQIIDQTGEKPVKTEQIHPQITPLSTVVPPKSDPAMNSVTSRPPPISEPKLTLSGIAWNKDSADRLAIINGQPTATGANVNGVIVEEILQDRVKLSHNGRIFELLIGRDARTE